MQVLAYGHGAELREGQQAEDKLAAHAGPPWRKVHAGGYLDPDAEKGDYLELHAEFDCIVAISACPGASSGQEKRPIGIQIYRPLIAAPE